nr:MAG TPA: hypothetical protein [Caudoviricetes sp.]
MQYYNRREPKKSPPNGLERTGTDAGIKAGLQIVYCSNNSYFIILFIEPI